MKKIIIFLFSLLLYSCTKKEKTHSSEFLLAQKELTEQLTKISKQTDFNGFGVAIVNENEVLYQNGFGIANLKPSKNMTKIRFKILHLYRKHLLVLPYLRHKNWENCNWMTQLTNTFLSKLPIHIIQIFQLPLDN